MEIIRSSSQQIREYYDNPAISQSALKELRKGVAHMVNSMETQKREREYFLIGSAVDTLLTGTLEDFNADFYVQEDDLVVSGKEFEIVQKFYTDNAVINPKLVQKPITEVISFIMVIADEMQYQMNWKYETRVDKIITKCSDYYELLKRIGNKKILTKNQYELVVQIVSNFRSHIPIFDSEVMTKHTNKGKLYFQLPVYEKILGVDVKGLLDVCHIIVLEDKKEVQFSIYDVKTTSKRVLDFIESAKAFRYDMQIAMYRLLVKTKLSKEYPDYKITFIDNGFLVESTISPAVPCIFNMDIDIIDKAETELMELIRTYKWHVDNNEWITDREILEKGNKLKIQKEQWEA